MYVDKTEFLWNLVSMGKPYFLSRPRRFGKSLFLSTLEAYFLGKKELFTGLRFTTIMRQIHEVTGKQAVVLVDEYDKPLLETLDYPEIFEDNRKTMKAFFSVLKSEDEHLKFAFLTGVTKFAQVSIFSDLNQLVDISMDYDFFAICGVSESELIKNSQPEIEKLAERQSLSTTECIEKLKSTYDGYHFSANTEGMYNPFSLLNAFRACGFRYYWFQTGTPSFLVCGIEKSQFDISGMVDGIVVGENAFSEYRYEEKSVIPLLYQSGYLTIKSYDKEFHNYTLMFPNEEVRYGFSQYLLPITAAVDSDTHTINEWIVN